MSVSVTMSSSRDTDGPISSPSFVRFCAKQLDGSPFSPEPSSVRFELELLSRARRSRPPRLPVGTGQRLAYHRQHSNDRTSIAAMFRVARPQWESGHAASRQRTTAALGKWASTLTASKFFAVSARIGSPQQKTSMPVFDPHRLVEGCLSGYADIPARDGVSCRLAMRAGDTFPFDRSLDRESPVRARAQVQVLRYHSCELGVVGRPPDERKQTECKVGGR